MRIISGKYKGIRLSTPPKGRLRPALQKVREALFNIIDVENKLFIDIFAGTGSIGFEAISHYAKHVTFIEKDKLHAKILNENIKNLQLEKELSKVIALPFEVLVKQLLKENKVLPHEKYDYIFLGPPYALWKENWIQTDIAQSELFTGESVIICEHTKYFDLPNMLTSSKSNLILFNKKYYGETVLSFYQKAQ